MIELLNLPAILGMIPLLLFIVAAFVGISQSMALVIATVVAMLLAGVGPVAYSNLLCSAMGGSLALIGLIILLSGGLGKMLETSGISHTIVYTIVNKIGVKTENQGILVTMVCSMVIVGMLGTLAGGNAIIAPVIIPVVAAVGISKSSVAAIFDNAGEAGLILGPLSPAVVALLSLTGLSFGRMMLCAAIPYALVWMVTLFFSVKKIQKKTRETDRYENMQLDATFVPTAQDKRNTVVFLTAFVVFIAYGLFTGQGTTYLPIVMIGLGILIGVLCKKSADTIFEEFVRGSASGLKLFLLFILFDPLFAMMTSVGAFEALAIIFSNLVGIIGGGSQVLVRAFVTILGSLVGGFGVEGAAVVQMQITDTLFSTIKASCNMPPELWAVALIAASRITNIVYPSANMIGQMGIARCDNMKALLQVGWTVAGTIMLFIAVYAFVGAAFLY